jgi:transposase
MSTRRVHMDRLRELVRLRRMGTTSAEIARLLHMSVNTERPYREALEKAGLLHGPVDQLPSLEELKAAVLTFMPPKVKPQQVSTIEPWRSKVVELLAKDLKPRAIYDRLRLEEEEKFQASYPAMRRFCDRLAGERGVRPEDVAIPVDTAPGEIAQVDFGYVGKLYDPETRVLRRAWVFVMVLGYSRHMFARIVFDQKTETWLRLHVEAFEKLGGVVETVVPDNLKAAVVRAAFAIDDDTALNRSYRELARHYGFKVDPAPPRKPKKKGKVESGVKYVKRNGLAGREGDDVTIANAALDRWIVEIAGTRKHGTTGRQPLAVFEAEERAALKPLPAAAYELVEWKDALVHPDTHVAFHRRLYSVPWTLLGKTVWIRATRTSVVVYFDDERVATHERNGRGNRSTIEAHLPEHRGDLRHRSRSYWEQRAARIGPEALAYVREVFDKDEVLSMLRVAQAIVTHLETHPRDRAERACRRARHFANYSYQGLKGILRKALDLEPLPGEQATQAPLANPRFARSAADLFSNLKETTSDCDRRLGAAPQEAPTLRCAPDA